MREALRDLHSKRSADTEGARHAHLSSVHPNELPDQCEADARSFVGPPCRARHAMEALEDTGKLALGYADAAIGDFEDHRFRALADSNRDTPLVGKFERVREQIENELLRQVAVDPGGL